MSKCPVRKNNRSFDFVCLLVAGEIIVVAIGCMMLNIKTIDRNNTF